MADSFSVEVKGLDDLKRILAEIPQDLRKKVILGALRKAARVPLQAARQAVPVMAGDSPYRTPGLLKKRLVVRTSKAARAAGNIGVFINVKPAAGAKFQRTKGRDLLGAYSSWKFKKASERGAKSKLDPYYWRFVEFGTRKMKAKSFLQPAGATLDKALSVFMAEVVPQINKYNTRK